MVHILPLCFTTIGCTTHTNLSNVRTSEAFGAGEVGVLMGGSLQQWLEKLVDMGTLGGAISCCCRHCQSCSWYLKSSFKCSGKLTAGMDFSVVFTLSQANSLPLKQLLPTQLSKENNYRKCSLMESFLKADSTDLGSWAVLIGLVCCVMHWGYIIPLLERNYIVPLLAMRDFIIPLLPLRLHSPVIANEIT